MLSNLKWECRISLVNKYELTLVFPAEGTESEKTLTKVKGWVEAGKGKIAKTDQFGVKEFAYPIRKLTSGKYVYMEAQLPPEGLASIERRLRIEPSILRYLLVKCQ